MKLLKMKRTVKGKEYDSFKMSLSKREAHLLSKLGDEFTIEDVDEKTGAIWLKTKTNTTFEDSTDPVCSFRLHVSGEEWLRFKRICKRDGLNVCWVLSGFVRAVNEVPGLVEEPGGVKNVYVFYGKPRSKFRELAWQEEGVKDNG